MPANVPLVLAAVALAANIAGPLGQGPSMTTQSAQTHAGFRFEDGHCDRDPAYCARRQPKAWTADEIAIVKQALAEIQTRPRGRQVLTRCRRNGFDTLRRYAAVGEAEWSTVPEWAPRPQANLQWDPLSPSIDLNDEFFRDSHLRDPFSGRPGYPVSAAILLHECMHTLDDVSKDPAFREVVGFVGAGTSWRFTAGTQSEVAAVMEFKKEIVRLARLNDRAGMWHANRRFALSMKPNRARQYLPNAVVAYFDRHVFSRLTQQ